MKLNNIIYYREIAIDISKRVRNNGSLFLHIVVIPSKNFEKPLSLNEAKQVADSTYIKGKLTQYAVPKSSTFNLLKDESKVQAVKPATHLTTKFAVMMCNEELNIPDSDIPVEIIKLLRINHKRQFLPIVIQDFLQTRLRDLEEITPETKNTKFLLSYSPTSIGKLKFLIQMEMTFSNFLALGFTMKDVDEVKGVFADTNVYLLCATVFIGSIHVIINIVFINPNSYILTFLAPFRFLVV